MGVPVLQRSRLHRGAAEVTLILRPVGRGNWRIWRMVAPDHLLVQIEDRFPFGGLVWRIVGIEP